MGFVKKYSTIAVQTWQSAFAYPASFFLWRIRQVLLFLIAFSLWDAVFRSTDSLLGYSQASMMSYVFLANVANILVLSSRTINVANVINSGDLSSTLLQPVNFFLVWFSQDIADKLQNLFFGVIEMAFFLILFQPVFYLPQSIVLIGLFVLALCGAIVLYFFINMLFGFLGFWTPDVWAPRFLFMMVLQLTTGSFFPLDVFPAQIVAFFSYTPFPYLIFFPVKVWMGSLDSDALVRGFGMMAGWILFFACTTYIVWKKGLRVYGSEGR